MAVEWKKVHVFISSTFKDMHAERDYLVKRVFPKLSEWCERRRLRLVDIDLRWGVTEQDAQNRNVIKVCLDGIDACRPFFLCFLGQRRGWVPSYDPNKSEDDNQIPLSTIREFPDLAKYAGSTSATELEIVHALVDPLHRGIQRDPEKPGEYYEPAKYAFFYLRDDSYLKQIDAPEVRQVYTNESKNDDRELEKWRTEKIPATKRPTHSYSVHWNPELTTPELGLPGRLTDFQCQASPLDEAILKDLKEAIAARYPDHVESTELTDLQKEMDQQEQFLYASSEGFISRGDDFKDLDEYVKGSSNQLFVLTAPAGMGKSTLLAKWIEHYRSDPHAMQSGESIHFRFIGQSDRSTTVYSLLQMLLRELKEVAGKVTEEIPDDPQKLRQELPKLLETAGKKGKTVIVLDALNQLISGLSDLSWLPYQLPANIKLIVSFKSDDPGAEGLLQQMQGQVIHSQVKPFDELEDRRKLVNEYLKQYLKALDKSHLEVLVKSEGAERPLFLKVVLSELRVFGAFENLPEKIRSDFGKTPISAFEGVLKRLENDPAYSPIKPEQAVPLIFGLLAHAQQGLSAEELTGLLMQALGMEDNEASRQAASDSAYLYLRQVRSFLAHRDGRYDFFFESFKIAVRERYVAVTSEESFPKQTAQAWHRLLAEYFMPQSLYLDQDNKKPNLRKLTEMVFQQAWAGLGTDVEKTLLDYPYLEAKLIGQGIQELIEDYTLVPKASVSKKKEKPLSLLQGALRLSSHVLSKDASQLPSQLTGRLIGIEESDLREFLEQIRLQVKHSWLRPLTNSLKKPGSIEELVFTGHSSEVYKVIVTPDGRFAASRSVGSDGLVIVWDLLKGQEERILKKSGERGFNIDGFTLDGQFVRATDGYGKTSLWNLSTGREDYILKEYHGKLVRLAITFNGLKAIYGSHENDPIKEPLILWNLISGNEEVVLRQSKGAYKVIVSSDGEQAVACLHDHDIGVWTLANGKEEQVLKGHKNLINDLAISVDKQWLVSTSIDGEVKIWKLNKGKEAFTIQHTPFQNIDQDGGRVFNKHTTATAAITSDGQYVVSYYYDSIKIYNLVTGKEEYSFCHPDKHRLITSMAVSPGGKYIVATSVEDLMMWSLSTGKLVFLAKAHSANIRDITFSPDGKRAITASDDHTLKVWNLIYLNNDDFRDERPSQITSIAISPDGHHAAVASSPPSFDNPWYNESQAPVNCTINNINLLTGKSEFTYQVTSRNSFNYSRGIFRLIYFPDGKHLFYREGFSFSVLNLITGQKEPWPIQLSPDGILAFVPETQNIVSTAGEIIKVWNLTSGQDEHVMRGHLKSINTMMVTSDSQSVVSASGDGIIKVWDLASGKEKYNLPSLPKDDTLLTITSDGKRAILLSGGYIKVWNIYSGEEERTLKGRPFRKESSMSYHYFVALAQDGQHLITTSDQFDLIVWNLITGEEAITLRGHLSKIIDVAISSNGDFIVSSSEDQLLKVWDLSNRICLATYSMDSTSINLEIAPDGSSIVIHDKLDRAHFLSLEGK